MNFFGGVFFNGGFFGEVTTTKTGGKGDNKRSIYKPTGLPPYREPRVEQRVVETQEIAREVLKAVQQTPVQRMSLVEIDAEIGVLLRKKIESEDEEIMLLLLMAASA